MSWAEVPERLVSSTLVCLRTAWLTVGETTDQGMPGTEFEEERAVLIDQGGDEEGGTGDEDDVPVFFGGWDEGFGVGGAGRQGGQRRKAEDLRGVVEVDEAGAEEIGADDAVGVGEGVRGGHADGAVVVLDGADAEGIGDGGVRGRGERGPGADGVDAGLRRVGGVEHDAGDAGVELHDSEIVVVDAGFEAPAADGAAVVVDGLQLEPGVGGSFGRGAEGAGLEDGELGGELGEGIGREIGFRGEKSRERCGAVGRRTEREPGRGDFGVGRGERVRGGELAELRLVAGLDAVDAAPAEMGAG